MAVLIDATDIGDAWLKVYAALQPVGEEVNVAVAINDPLMEDLGVRRAIEDRLVELRDTGNPDFLGAQSMHTVANTIFPIGLYRPNGADSIERFYLNVARSEKQRTGSRKKGWGTYVGRLTSYPSRDGNPTNQLSEVLATLNGDRNFRDAYEMPLVAPNATDDDRLDNTCGAVLHADVRMDSRKRGGPCLAHISLTSLNGKLSMVALYRRHAYELRAYGNFVGLARLLAFLATESNRQVGQLLVVTGHACAEAPAREALMEAARAGRGQVTAIETQARPLGAAWSDLDLPARSR